MECHDTSTRLAGLQKLLGVTLPTTSGILLLLHRYTYRLSRLDNTGRWVARELCIPLILLSSLLPSQYRLHIFTVQYIIDARTVMLLYYSLHYKISVGMIAKG
jgi:hypothetical protein